MSLHNPVVPGFFPDPSICRSGPDYYLVCSSFEYFPGVPVFHSLDLANWRQIGNALDRPSQLDLPSTVDASRGIFAPTIRYHDRRFWIITTNVDLGRHFIVTAADPAGPWSDPTYVDVPGVDPSLVWDDDGACWLTVSGINNYLIDPDSGTVLHGPVPMWSGTGGQYPEAPHLYHIGGWWYLLVSEGGTHTGHAVSVARARTPTGPFEPGPANPILTHRGTDRPIQATGHADLFEAHDGTWWLVLLGIRPRGQWPSYHVLGRETFLAPVRWIDGWPVVDPVEPVIPAARLGIATPEPSTGTRFERDDFEGSTLMPCWISPRSRPSSSWSLSDRPGWLTLRARGSTLDRPDATIVGRRQQHHNCRAVTHLDVGSGRAGLTIRIDEAHHYDLEAAGGAVRVVARIGPLRQTVAQQAILAGPVTLAIATRTHPVLPPTITTTSDVGQAPTGVRPAGPDTISFELVTDERTITLAELDGRYLSTEVASGFTGRIIGMYVIEGEAAFDWFHYQPTPLPDEPMT